VEPQHIEGYFDRTIPILCILALKVLGWRPRSAAASSFPFMRHLVSERILRIWFRSISSNVFTADESGGDEISSCHPTFYPVFLLPLFHGFPVVAVSVVVGPLGIVDLPPGVVVVTVLV